MSSQAFIQLAKPVPQYLFSPPSVSILDCVTRELDKERMQNLQLVQQLAAERKRIQELEFRLMHMTQGGNLFPSGFHRVGSTESLASTEGTHSGLGSRAHSRENLLEISETPVLSQMASLVKVGAYPLSVRRQKIARYKAKLHAHMHQARVNRSYKGRSRIANSKPRERGRFVKSSSSQ